MFSWLSRCWGGMGVSSEFEKARIRSVITDWKVADDADICTLIATFRGQNPQLPKDAALNMFLSKMETGDDKTNPIFLLKHLYILDQTVEEQTALDSISAYYSSEFFSFKTASSIQSTFPFIAVSPIRQLIATYFMYIKKKATAYAEMDPRFFANNKTNRAKLIEESDTETIFIFVDKCFEIQKAIKEVNDKYKGRNKSVDLIKIIFTLLLKTYIFCYTIVSLCVKELFKKINKLSKIELQRMYKFVTFFNKDYTRNFVDLVESNKEIEVQKVLLFQAFKNVKYSQLILIDKNFIEYLEKLAKRDDEMYLVNNFNDNQLKFDEENNVKDMPEYIAKKILEEIKVAYRPRKLFELANSKEQNRSLDKFNSYQNLYSAEYESEYEQSVRNAFGLQQVKLLKQPSSNSENSVIRNKKKVELNFEESQNKFNENAWKSWQNIYAI